MSIILLHSQPSHCRVSFEGGTSGSVGIRGRRTETDVEEVEGQETTEQERRQRFRRRRRRRRKFDRLRRLQERLPVQEQTFRSSEIFRPRRSVVQKVILEKSGVYRNKLA